MKNIKISMLALAALIAGQAVAGETIVQTSPTPAPQTQQVQPTNTNTPEVKPNIVANSGTTSTTTTNTTTQPTTPPATTTPPAQTLATPPTANPAKEGVFASIKNAVVNNAKSAYATFDKYLPGPWYKLGAGVAVAAAAVAAYSYRKDIAKFVKKNWGKLLVGAGAVTAAVLAYKYGYITMPAFLAGKAAAKGAPVVVQKAPCGDMTTVKKAVDQAAAVIQAGLNQAGEGLNKAKEAVTTLVKTASPEAIESAVLNS